MLALFQHPETQQNAPVTGPESALHHFALSLPFAEQDTVMRWYDKIDRPYRVGQFGWRGKFTQDPEGNTVEQVAYDAALLDTPAG